MTRLLIAWALVWAATLMPAPDARAQAAKPNIVVIMGDDVGYWNLSYTTAAA